MKKNFYTIDDFAKEVDGCLAKSTVYRYVKQGVIPSKKLGNKILIPATYVKDFLSDNAEAAV